VQTSGRARAYGAVADADTLDLVTRLTLVFLLLADWIVGVDRRFKLALRAVAIVGLIAPPLHRSRKLWLLLALLMGLRTVLNWWTQDNHVFLLTYWCLAVYLSLTTDEPAETLATNGRALIGLSFAFAALWKIVLSKDFLDGALRAALARPSARTEVPLADGIALCRRQEAGPPSGAPADGCRPAEPRWIDRRRAAVHMRPPTECHGAGVARELRNRAIAAS
jgi:hypothetical protein